ncbi:dihydrodipicolinate reductase [Rickettsia akari str. Hartford]|uniref:4-hydroxy-tetrahydrodipicolinate reductase n=1 Tax=Rickettsia akari (strain Hartford) TaxID=293614 RepID=DAPB_RICAH|nr:4-hydroxy-tetrahydrodipicolinate reductase [Rickettsia akari]A8GMB6.1 RecName: Full=4-hydroxy-tetrahydrodipicolinate reductase; Short=HTPA reductase [Rickettsia akari str. Hartford]ABV74541.1 dihydrodipicolinate reductase [Rickettsia akari str. Hartford]
MINIGLSGSTGKMGKTILARIDKFKDCKISAKFNSTDDLDDLNNFCKNSDVIIDFSTPEILEKLINYALKHNTKLVIGTTGLQPKHFKLLEKAAKTLPILYSANMSTGANLLSYLAKKATKILDDYDIEILETHHRNKKDSPSGTAIMLAETIAREKGLNIVFNRGNRPRSEKEIGISSLRGGNVHSIHEISLLGDDEIITLKHEALNKNSFVIGAIKSAIWLQDKSPALYSMQDIYNYSLQKQL